MSASLSSLSWSLMPSRAEASRALLAIFLECLSLRTLLALGLGRREGARRPFLDGGRWRVVKGDKSAPPSQSERTLLVPWPPPSLPLPA